MEKQLICDRCKDGGIVQVISYYGDGLQDVRYNYCGCVKGLELAQKQAERYKDTVKQEQSK